MEKQKKHYNPILISHNFPPAVGDGIARRNAKKPRNFHHLSRPVVLGGHGDREPREIIGKPKETNGKTMRNH